MAKPKYEVWKSKRADGGENYHLWPAGKLAPEIQEHLEKVPISPEMEEDLALIVERMNVEQQKPSK